MGIRQGAHGRRARTMWAAVLLTAAVGGGSMPASAAKVPEAPAVPSAPLDVRVVKVGDTRVDLAWSPPATGASRVRSYRITEVNSGLSVTVSGRNRKHSFVDLTNLAPARFVVVAINAAGASEPSAPTPVTSAKPRLYLRTQEVPEGLKPVDQAVEVGVNNPAAAPMQIRVRSLGKGTAKPGNDVLAFDTVVTLPANAASVAVPIRLRDDLVAEGPETLALEVSSADAVPVKSVAYTTILDDDSAPWLYLDGADPVREGDTGTTAMRFGLRLSQALDTPLTVGVDVSQAGERHLVELGDLPTSITIPAGATSVPLDVPVLGDRTVEESEQLTVRIDAPDGVTVPVFRRGSLVVDDDEASSPGTGADVELTGGWWYEGPDDGPGVRFQVRNPSAVAATGVTLRLVHTGQYLEGDVSVLPDFCRYDGTFDRALRWPSEFVRVHRWACDVPDIAPGATATVTLAPPRTGTVVAGVITRPYDDPDHGDNLLTLTTP